MLGRGPLNLRVQCAEGVLVFGTLPLGLVYADSWSVNMFRIRSHQVSLLGCGGACTVLGTGDLHGLNGCARAVGSLTHRHRQCLMALLGLTDGHGSC
jgi:hypothetical protein